MLDPFKTENDLLPAIIQNGVTLQVLMLGYMNRAAYLKTIDEKRVCFFSRSKNRLWTKGESSGNYLLVETMAWDCDADALLIKVIPAGPVCHTGAISCFGERTAKGFLYELERTIGERIDGNDGNSYTNRLFKNGINKIAQKVGEEAVELIIEAKDSDMHLFTNEAADLLYHFLVLLKAKDTSLTHIEEILLLRAKR